MNDKLVAPDSVWRLMRDVMWRRGAVNWQAISAVADIVSAFVVLASLSYIAIQVRDTKRAAMRTDRQERNNVLSRIPLDTPELAHAIAKVNGIDGQSMFKRELQQAYSLSDGELELYFSYLAFVWRNVEIDFLYSPDPRQVELVIERRLAIPSFRKFIEDRGPRFSPEFIAVVDRVKKRIDAEQAAT